MKAAVFLLILIVHVLILSQLNFTAWPEMLTYPYLLTNGFTLYKDFIYPYPPGLVLILSAIFSYIQPSPSALRILTWLLILTIDLLLFKTLKKITKNSWFTLGFLAVYVVLQSFLDGNMLWFDIATIPALLASFYFSLKWVDKKSKQSLFLTVLFLLISVLIKQVSIIYLAGFLIFYILITRKILLKEFLVIFLTVSVVFASLMAFLVYHQVLEQFWRWVLLYPLAEWPKFPGYVDYVLQKRELLVLMLLVSPLFWMVGIVKKGTKNLRVYLGAIFLISATIAVYPRFSFFHLQPLIAFLIIFLTLISDTLINIRKMWLFFSLVLVTLVIVGLNFKQSVGSQVRFYDQSDRELAGKITKLSNSSSNIFLLGLNSSQYLFTKSLPPPHWSDNFGWYLDIPGVQDWVIGGFSSRPPEYIFWRIPDQGRWYDLGVYQPFKITSYLRQHYRKIDKIEPNIEIWKRQD